MIKVGKIICFILCVLLIGFGSVGIYKIVETQTTTSMTSSECRQPGSYFVSGEDRFVLVDESEQNIGGETYKCKVFADKYMLTMYLWVEHGNLEAKTASMTQIFYEDGSPMIYDDVTLEEELYESN